MISASENCIYRIKNLEEIMQKDEIKIRNSKKQIKCIFEVYSYFKQYLILDIMAIFKDLDLSYNTDSKYVYLLIKLKILNI